MPPKPLVPLGDTPVIEVALKQWGKTAYVLAAGGNVEFRTTVPNDRQEQIMNMAIRKWRSGLATAVITVGLFLGTALLTLAMTKFWLPVSRKSPS